MIHVIYIIPRAHNSHYNSLAREKKKIIDRMEKIIFSSNGYINCLPFGYTYSWLGIYLRIIQLNYFTGIMTPSVSGSLTTRISSEILLQNIEQEMQK